jgi:signal transduction histidine kinase
VVLKVENKILSLSIRDDGRGFDTEGLTESEGVGIAGMRERAMLAGGVLEVSSEKNKGCHVLFKVSI